MTATELLARYLRCLLDNMAIVGETYPFSGTERAAFPLLLRYMDSIWWGTLRELKRAQDDPARVRTLLAYLRRHMTRDDLRL